MPATRTRAGATIGRAGFIIDNLLAEKKGVPMIVVMPNGSLPRPANMPPLHAWHTAVARGPRAAMEGFQNRFTDELLKDVIPLRRDRHYRVEDRAREPGDRRAFDGGRPDACGSSPLIRISLPMSPSGAPGLFGGNPEDFEKRNESFFKGRRSD